MNCCAAKFAMESFLELVLQYAGLSFGNFYLSNFIQHAGVEFNDGLVSNAVQIEVVEDLLLLFEHDSLRRVLPNAMKRRATVVQRDSRRAVTAVSVLCGLGGGSRLFC